MMIKGFRLGTPAKTTLFAGRQKERTRLIPRKLGDRPVPADPSGIPKEIFANQ
jgi:hypothetical protein